tara:strand:- start:6646 stop:6903 length:258 start_codon:yes stop_codon:yes gene_type:complete
MRAQIDAIYRRVKTPDTYRGQGDTVIDACCTVHDGFITLIARSNGYLATIYAGKFSGAKCDCKGYQITKKCKHLLALAMWARGER